MRMTRVSSSTLHSVGYDTDTQTLYIRFLNGITSVYRDVPPLVYAELMSADSMTAYVKQKIQDFYPYRKVSRMTPVSSTSIQSVGYDPGEKILYIKFNNGYTYEYQDVSPATYAELMNAFSIGAYLNRHIRNRHPYHRIWTERSRLGG